jgi:lipopolysaccharide heptosyltransferase I
MAQSATQQRRRILIIKPSSLGDVIHGLPVLAGLRAAYPDAYIAWLVASAFAPLLTGHPLLDEVIPFDRRLYGRILRSRTAAAHFWRLMQHLRRARFDLVIDLQGLARSGLLAWISGARERVGFATAREGAWAFYTQRVHVPPDVQHAVEKNLYLARSIGVQVEAATFPLNLDAPECSAARHLVAQAAQRPIPHFVAVLPGARWDTKRWPAERWAHLIDRLSHEGWPPCVLLGAPVERATADAILAACSTPVIDLVGRTSVRELAAVLAVAELIVCHDSGPMHIAAALGKPMVALFGPTNPARTGPYDQSARVVALPLPCVPCYQRRCPLGHHNCMQQLDVQTVLQHVRETWAVCAAPSAIPTTTSSPTLKVPTR